VDKITTPLIDVLYQLSAIKGPKHLFREVYYQLLRRYYNLVITLISKTHISIAQGDMPYVLEPSLFDMLNTEFALLLSEI